MKWLVLTPTETVQDIAQVQRLLASSGDPCDCVSLQNAGNSAAITSLVKKMDEASYCIMLEGDAVLHTQAGAFSLGYLLGHKIPVFLRGSCSNLKASFTPSLLLCFDTIDRLAVHIKMHYQELRTAQKQKAAYNELFFSGTPFTTDCFASHIAHDDEKECTLFLDAGMDANSRDSGGTPMICIASRNDRLDRIKWLLENGADINAVSKDRGYSAAMDAVWRCDYDAAELLVSRGANLNFISRDGQSILVLAVGTGNERICELLAKNGANPDIKDSMGMSARDYAKLFKKSAVSALFDQYAPVKA